MVLCSLFDAIELTLNVIWSAEKTAALQNEQSFPVIVHRPETTPPDKLSSLIAEPGKDLICSSEPVNVRFCESDSGSPRGGIKFPCHVDHRDVVRFVGDATGNEKIAPAVRFSLQ